METNYFHAWSETMHENSLFPLAPLYMYLRPITFLTVIYGQRETLHEHLSNDIFVI